jgi:mortality factor 4-like protein 1
MTIAEFSAGDTVFAIDSGKKYKAKIIKAQICNGVNQYFIHFDGWNKKWDKWTDSSGLLKFDDTNEKSNKRKSGSNLEEKSDDNFSEDTSTAAKNKQLDSKQIAPQKVIKK